MELILLTQSTISDHFEAKTMEHKWWKLIFPFSSPPLSMARRVYPLVPHFFLDMFLHRVGPLPPFGPTPHLSDARTLTLFFSFLSLNFSPIPPLLLGTTSPFLPIAGPLFSVTAG